MEKNAIRDVPEKFRLPPEKLDAILANIKNKYPDPAAVLENRIEAYQKCVSADLDAVRRRLEIFDYSGIPETDGFQALARLELLMGAQNGFRLHMAGLPGILRHDLSVLSHAEQLLDAVRGQNN